MIAPLLIAVLAAVTNAQCQEVTQTVTRCTTSYSEIDLPTGEPTRTAYFTTTTINNFSITSTTQSTITVTPAATTFYGVANTTTTLTTTVVTTPAAFTVPTPAGFSPVLKSGMAAIPGPTATAVAVNRHRRAATLQSRAEHLQLLKRLPETPAGNTAGYIVLPGGKGQDLVRTFPVFVECQVSVNINSTETTIVTGEPVTSMLMPATATAINTTTFTATETVLSVAAQPTEYAACQSNNLVNNVIGDDFQPLYFDRYVFANPEGFKIANTKVVNTTSAVNCCIVCQNTEFCAGTFYVPSERECHVLLTQAAPTSSIPSLPGSTSLPPFPLPSSNTSLPYPTASGAPYPAGNDTTAAFPTVASGMLPSGFSTLIPIATPISSSAEGSMSIQPIVESPLTGTFDRPGAGTCSAGSLSLFIGKAYGRVGFNPDDAIVISNGGCGRHSVDFEEAPVVTPEQLQHLDMGNLIGSAKI